MNIDLSLSGLVMLYFLFAFPFVLFHYLQTGLIKQTIVAAARMTVQLFLVGLYLKYIFIHNNFFLTFLWVVIMLVVANFSILEKAGLRASFFFWRLLAGVPVATLLISGWFIVMAIRPDPIYDARYMVPVLGMVLGNCLRGNVIGLERFYSSIRDNEQEFATYLMLGATLHEAIRPYMRAALRAALNPTLGSMATIGIVSLPGMMTGQILGGAMPMQAIKYQIGIMICIFTAMVMAVVTNIFFSLPAAFDEYQRLRQDIFR